MCTELGFLEGYRSNLLKRVRLSNELQKNTETPENTEISLISFKNCLKLNDST